MSNINELIPVKYKKKFLTPTTRGRAYYLVTHNKAVWFKDKRGTTCIRMKVEPSGDVIDEVILGIDPGTLYDGYTASTNKGQFNSEFIYTDKEKNRNFIKENSNKRRGNRRLKRNRLRHRKIRFNNRIGNKESNTSVYYRQHRQNQIKYFKKLFNVNEIVIEDVKFNHFKYDNGKSFSPLEVGKNKLYNWIRTLGIEPQLVAGYDTANERKSYFGDDPKLKNKSLDSFYTHSIDSFILTRFVDSYQLLNKVTHYWHRRKMINRRELTKFKNKVRLNKFYYRYDKGGEIRIAHHYSKLKKIRVKVNDNKSNHGPWNYMYTNVVETFKKFKPNYGGTIVRGNSRYGRNMIGKSKYFSDKGYIYYQ